MIFGLNHTEFFWLMFTREFVLEFFLFYRYGPIGSEAAREKVIAVLSGVPPQKLMIVMYISMLVSSLMWVVSFPYHIYKILRYGFPEPRKYD